jgi:anaerobic magnesium-protoporphyrin IX monomethyl ester cyclase
MKIMITTPPAKTTELWPPLGLLYIAANVKKHRNDDVQVVDAFCLNLDGDELVERVVKERPDVFGMNCSTHTFLQAIETIRKISERLPDTVILLGGYHATFAAEQILRGYPFIDYIIKGEAEEAIVDLLDCIESSKRPYQVAGISFLDEGRHVSNQLAIVQDLDALPMPDRGLLAGVNYGYTMQGIPLTFGKFTTISTSRGCPFNCSYCSCAAFSLRKWRYRSAESVVEEMQMLYDQGYKSVVLVDDNFTHREERVEKICGLIREKGIKMQFYCEGRVNNASLGMLKTMKRAGFDVMYFGAESASETVLEYYNKKIRPAQITTAVANAKAADMIVITSFILGAPAESDEEIRKTIDFIYRLRPHAVEINILDYLVGTPLWQQMETDGIIGPDDWKRNHRVYEYVKEKDRDKMEALVQQGYDAYLNAWKNKSGAMELLSLLAHNKTARRVIFSNLFNPKAREVVSNGLRAFGEKPRTGN